MPLHLMPPLNFAWSFALPPDVSVETGDGRGIVHLVTPTDRTRLRVSDGEWGVLQALAAGPQTQDELLRERRGAADAVAGTIGLLVRLERLGLLGRAVAIDGRVLVESVPHGPPPAPPPARPPGAPRLSRFAVARRTDEGGVALQSPLAWADVVLRGREVLSLLDDLTKPVSRAPGAVGWEGADSDAVAATLLLLDWCGVLDRDDDRAKWWSAEALAFHTRSRAGYARRPLGKTYPWGPDEPPDPSHGGEGRLIGLPVPDVERLRASDPPYAAVADARRSLRVYGATPLSIEALGEFLFRTLADRGGTRPAPSAGARYPLQAYLAVARCTGLDEGLYAYSPQEHILRQTCGPSVELTRLLGRAAEAAGQDEAPQILVVLGARFARTSWMYGDLAYSLILKEVGALFQSMGLAAAAMGLAACPLGVGDSRLFSDLLGGDGLLETSVGELSLGSGAPPEGT